MEVKVKRIDTSLPMPVYETKGAVGFDLLARVETSVSPGEVALIPANVIVAIPEGYMLVVASRSSTPMRKGLSVPHGIGIIDNDYCGNEDEIKIQVYNFTPKVVKIVKGEKIAQGIFVRVNKFKLVETDKMSVVSRGGYGSTTKAE